VRGPTSVACATSVNVMGANATTASDAAVRALTRVMILRDRVLSTRGAVRFFLPTPGAHPVSF
jgi:hypothetical protein